MSSTPVSLQTEDLWPELKEHSVPDCCPEVKPPTSGRAASDGQQSGRLRNPDPYGNNKEPEILLTYNRVSTYIEDFKMPMCIALTSTSSGQYEAVI